MRISAAVTRTPGAAFVVETVELDEPAPDEVRVRITATGLCHTDIVVRDQLLPTPLPAVLGHEGAGVVEAVGSEVEGVRIGDHVVLGFAACRNCGPCGDGQPAYCSHFFELNFAGRRTDGSSSLSSPRGEISSHFFGQSSFATHANVQARNVVIVSSEAPLDLLGPLGCGIMTGAGAVLNTLAVKESQSVLVSGGGPVGLSGVMAAKAAGADPIILVDPLESRRSLAMELGATHVIDPDAGDLNEAVRQITPNGVERILESSGSVAAIEKAISLLGTRGRFAMVGVPKSLEATLSVPVLPMLSLGSSICGVTEGDADPQKFIPELLAMHRDGRFPFDRLITQYPLSRINEAIEDQHAGRCVKAVLVMDRPTEMLAASE